MKNRSFIEMVQRHTYNVWDRNWTDVYFAAEGLVVVRVMGSEKLLLLFFDPSRWTVDGNARGKYKVETLPFGCMVKLNHGLTDTHPAIRTTLADDFTPTGDQYLTILHQFVPMGGMRT